MSRPFPVMQEGKLVSEQKHQLSYTLNFTLFDDDEKGQVETKAK